MKTISDEQFRAYFLGKLAEPEADDLEMRCALSAELSERAQAVERELADDYLLGMLAPQDARLFENVYLKKRARQNRLHVAKGLWQIAREEPRRVAQMGRKSLRQTFFGGRKALRLAFGCLILLLIFGAAIFYLLMPKLDQTDVAAVKVPNPPLRVENPVMQAEETENQNSAAADRVNSIVESREVEKNLDAPLKNQPVNKPVPPKNSAQNPALTAALTLYPGALRAEGEQSITIPPDAENLNLLLKLPEDAGKYPIYRIVLKAVEGEAIYTSPNQKSLNLTIPADKLENRTYLVFLEGRAKGDFESVAEYSFRVRR
jgi:hypothetical protein